MSGAAAETSTMASGERVIGTSTLMAADGADEAATGTSSVMASGEKFFTGPSTLAADLAVEPLTVVPLRDELVLVVFGELVTGTSPEEGAGEMSGAAAETATVAPGELVLGTPALAAHGADEAATGTVLASDLLPPIHIRPCRRPPLRLSRSLRYH